VNTKRHSLLCPNCRKLISDDESRCPYCGTRNPGSWWKNNLWTQSLHHPEQLVYSIIYINVGMYFMAILLFPTTFSVSLNPFSFLMPDPKSLLLLGESGTIPINVYHRWWSLLAANYLHGGIIHIFFNMVALRQLAPLVIREYGTYRMVIVYTIGGVIGFWVSYLAGVRYTIGASAAVCALIGALLYYGKSRGGVYGNMIYKQVVGWVVGLFLLGLLARGIINNWGHGGGLVAGVLLGFLLGYAERRKENIVHKTIAGICLIATILTLGWAVVSSIIYRFMS
jgi:rhomboid protease GluP